MRYKRVSAETFEEFEDSVNLLALKGYLFIPGAFHILRDVYGNLYYGMMEKPVTVKGFMEE